MEVCSDEQHSLDIAPVRSEFCNDVTEFRFLTHHLAETQSQLRITLIFCSFFYLAFSLTDIAVLGYGRDAFILFMGRLTVAVTAAGCGWLTYRQRQSVAITRLAATAVEIVGMSTFMLVVVYRPDELPWHAMSMAIMLIVVYIFIPNRLVYSLAVALSATGVFIIVAFAVGKSAVMTAHKRDDPISKWLCQLREKSGWQKAAVAMANKNARILWAMMTKGCRFDPRHVSVKPTGSATMMA